MEALHCSVAVRSKVENGTERMGEDSSEMDKLRRKLDEDLSEICVLEEKCDKCEKCKRGDALLDELNASFVEKASVLEMDFDPCDAFNDILPEPTDAQGNIKGGEWEEFRRACLWFHVMIALEMRMELATLFALLDIDKEVYRERYRAGPGHLLLAARVKRFGYSMDDWELSFSRKARDTTASGLSDKQRALMKRLRSPPYRRNEA